MAGPQLVRRKSAAGPQKDRRGPVQPVVTQRYKRRSERAYGPLLQAVGDESAYKPGSVATCSRGGWWRTAIHLGPPLPVASCGLPAGIGRAALERLR